MSEYRHEYKYIINAKDGAILSSIAEGILKRDEHAGEDGRYIIRSLYFDTEDDRCLYENINGCDPRWKFRIRYYGLDTSYIVLEKKSKVNGMTKKESCRISPEIVGELVNGSTLTLQKTDPKFAAMFMEYNLVPRVIVTYEREPFVYMTGNVRVTFDRAITSSNQFDRFLEGDYTQRPVMEAGRQILEVKWDEILPYFIKNSLNVNNMSWTAFSKYTMCRKYHI